MHAEVEAIFAHGYVVAVLVGVDGLWRSCSPGVGFVDALPWLFFDWCFPTEVAYGRLGVGYAHVERGAVVEDSLDVALLDGGA